MRHVIDIYIKNRSGPRVTQVLMPCSTRQFLVGLAFVRQVAKSLSIWTALEILDLSCSIIYLAPCKPWSNEKVEKCLFQWFYTSTLPREGPSYLRVWMTGSFLIWRSRSAATAPLTRAHRLLLLIHFSCPCEKTVNRLRQPLSINRCFLCPLSVHTNCSRFIVFSLIQFWHWNVVAFFSFPRDRLCLCYNFLWSCSRNYKSLCPWFTERMCLQ